MTPVVDNPDDQARVKIMAKLLRMAGRRLPWRTEDGAVVVEYREWRLRLVLERRVVQ